MKRIVIVMLMMVAALWQPAGAQERLTSPDGRLELRFELKDSVPYYSLYRDGKAVVLPSKMGFELEWRDDLAHAFVLKDTKRSTFDETWHPVWGEEANIRNHYNEMLVTLEQPAGAVTSADGRSKTMATVMQLRFRLYDDGLGFRYEFPQETLARILRQENPPKKDNALVCFWIKEELTEFVMAGNHTAWWIPGDYDQACCHQRVAKCC